MAESAEVLGNFSYTTTAGKLAPMFRTEEASAFAFFNEVCYSGDPFQTFVLDVQGKVTKSIKPGQGGLNPYISMPAK